LRLRWVYDAGETLEQPNLTAPVIKSVAAASVVGMILVPAGYDAAAMAAPIEMVYQRADAQMQLSKLLGERPADAQSLSSPELLPAQQRFFWYCRQSEYLAGKTENPTAWLQKVKDLRRVNDEYARQFAYEKTRSQAEEKAFVPDTAGAPGLFSLPDNGRPVYWRQDRATAPVLVLTSRIAEQTEQALLASEVLLLILVAIGILTYFPAISGRLAGFWPEQLLLLAWIGWYLLGGSLVGVLLAVTGAGARIILLGAWVRRLFRRATAPRAGSSYLPS
jgi:hypothetical protein